MRWNRPRTCTARAEGGTRPPAAAGHRAPGPRAAFWLGLLLAGLVALPGLAPARERGADGKFDRKRSDHFLLLQDVDIDHRTGSDGTRQFERAVLGVLENAYERVEDTLGLRSRSDIRVYVYDAGVFDARFSRAFGFRAAGFFDGSIHVRGGTRVDPRLARTLHHEYVHAVLHAEGGPGLFPAWLNEGLAEYFERFLGGQAALLGSERAVLIRAAQRDAWIPLGSLSGVSFTHLREGAAALAYLEAYALVEHLVRREGMSGLRSFCKRLLRGRNLQRALRSTYGLTLVDLERALLDELR